MVGLEEEGRFSNVPGYQASQCFVVNGEGREPALQTVTAFVEHQEKIAEKASELELQHFTSPLKHLEETWGPFSQPPPLLASEEEEMEKTTGFDDDSDDDSDNESNDDEKETDEDRPFMGDDLEEEEDISFYRRVDLEL